MFKKEETSAEIPTHTMDYDDYSNDPEWSFLPTLWILPQGNN